MLGGYWAVSRRLLDPTDHPAMERRHLIAERFMFHANMLLSAVKLFEYLTSLSHAFPPACA